MKPRKRHPMEELLIFTAEQLKKQYPLYAPEIEQFEQLIAAAVAETDAGEKEESHEQGKLPPAPTVGA